MEMQYKGHTANPSDYECPDGDLAMSLNLIPENGPLSPILPPGEVLELTDGDTVLYVHETTAWRHYIVRDRTGRIIWIDGTETSGRNELYTLKEELYQVTSVGNTLILLTEGMTYFLWKDGAYLPLGNHIPDVEISFGLVGHPRMYSCSDKSLETFRVDLGEKISNDKLHDEFPEEVQTTLTEQVMARVNKFVADQTVNKGRFCFPFFVRYALRLFDGSLVCHSAPVLMNPSTTSAPVVMCTSYETKDSKFKSMNFDIMLVAATLDYRLIGNDDSRLILEKWSDIVKSVDVFISKPVYPYDQDGKIKAFNDEDNMDSSFIGRLYATTSHTRPAAGTPGGDNGDGPVEAPPSRPGLSGASYISSGKRPEFAEDTINTSINATDLDLILKAYTEWKYSRIFAMYFTRDGSYPGITLHLPEFSDEKKSQSYKDTFLFYRLCSIPLEELSGNSGGRTDITVDEEYLQSLVTREVMTDDYLTRDRIIPKYAFPYNSRLNLANLERSPFRGFPAESMLAYCTHGAVNWQHIKEPIEGTEVTHVRLSVQPVLTGHTFDIIVYIKENMETYRVQVRGVWGGLADFFSYEATNDNGHYIAGRSWGTFFFYPNPDAYKMVIFDDISYSYFIIDLKPHEFLNGAYATFGYGMVREESVSNHGDSWSDGNIPIPSKIYTSEVNNPFYFPLLGINTVGTGEVYAVCAAAKALSEGQFGQFPLYAFTSEGVWALEVSATGSYSARQPITRDVCLNTGSITQIDSAVLFATARGIMLISGSETRCITDAINTADPFPITGLPGHEGIVTVFNKKADVRERTDISGIRMVPFPDFIKGCRMIYDYTHQRIIAYNKDKGIRYSYVFSMKTQLWGMMLTDIYDNVNSYPEVLAMSVKKREDGTSVPMLVDLSRTSSDTSTGLVISRPFKMGDPTVFKTVDTIIQRGNFHRDHVAQVLYGSNDLRHWFPVWSSADMYLRGFYGSPYKFFRTVVITGFDKSESLFGCTVQFTPRQTNQPR